jgi:hypothetical protein
MVRSHLATAHGSNRTYVPMWNEGMRPAFACLGRWMYVTGSNDHPVLLNIYHR